MTTQDEKLEKDLQVLDALIDQLNKTASEVEEWAPFSLSSGVLRADAAELLCRTGHVADELRASVRQLMSVRLELSWYKVAKADDKEG